VAWLSKQFRRRWKVRLSGWFGPTLFRLWGRTLRIRFVGLENYTFRNKSGRLPVFALWHQNIPLGVFVHRDQEHGVMVSQHHDGDIVARVIKPLGYRFSRGSTSRGGARALLEMVDSDTFPGGVVLTPDGPLGPPFSIAPGVFQLAARTQRPIVAVGFTTSRFHRFQSWDRMIAPLPFAKVVVAYGTPFFIAQSSGVEVDVSALEKKIHQAFDTIQAKADGSLEEWR